jgi:hypothetical protein
MYTDSTVEQHYIPVDLLRAGLPNGYQAIAQPAWPLSEKKYVLKLAKPMSAIKSLVIDPLFLSGDVDRQNNRKDF